MHQDYIRLREQVAACLMKVLIQLCGGSNDFLLVEDNNEGKKKEKENILASVSFPNKDPSSIDGKAHNIETRIALSLFHRFKRKQAAGEVGVSVTIVSDLGLGRDVRSPREFAELISIPLENMCKEEGFSNDVRVQPSGVICIVTLERSQLLRAAGKLPCTHCTQWCKGEKGLWWHQQQNHKIEYSQATAVAAASTNSLALIPYGLNSNFFSSFGNVSNKTHVPDFPPANEDPFDSIKIGDLYLLKKAVTNGFNPAESLDRKGASPLMWAAGGGYVEMVRYLIEECNCDPGQGQRGKRSFSGRTALHWAARNGHFDVVKYLVNKCDIDLEAATVDGTTAFGWACWQGHLSVMKFLQEHGCDIHRKNSFGCNAVLWCAQGNGDISRMKWLYEMGCEMTLVNNNGHGVVHKAAQRGQEDVCRWFFEEFVSTSSSSFEIALKLVGPDSDGYCPSDLAGMEGFERFAKWLASNEMDLIDKLKLSVSQVQDHGNGGESSTTTTKCVWPSWFYESVCDNRTQLSEQELNYWEKFGGIRRMRSRLKDDLKQMMTMPSSMIIIIKDGSE